MPLLTNGQELKTTARRDKYLRRRLLKCKKSSAHIKIVELLCDAVGNNMKTVQKILIGQFPDIFSKQKVSYDALCRWRRFSYRDHQHIGRKADEDFDFAVVSKLVVVGLEKGQRQHKSMPSLNLPKLLANVT